MIVNSPFEIREIFANTGIGWACQDGLVTYISCQIVDPPENPIDGQLWDSSVTANDYQPIIDLCDANGWTYFL